MSIDAGTTYIATLRAASAERDRLALRGGLERALAGVSLRPPGLPPAAVLCVRHLRDPLPGALGGRDDARATAAWERAAVAALGELARDAAHPAHGPVPPSAAAVLFADRAELLVCLARDWCAGALAERWWWPNLLRAADLPRAAIAAWLAAPEHIPAAMGALAASDHAVAFVAAFSPAEALELARHVAHIFGIPALQIALSERQDATAQEDAGADIRDDQAGLPDAAHHAMGGAGRAPPWLPWVRESAVCDREPARAALLGIALLLQRAPASARGAAFAHEVRTWWSASGAAPLAAPPDSEPERDRASPVVPAPAALVAPAMEPPSATLASDAEQPDVPRRAPALPAGPGVPTPPAPMASQPTPTTARTIPAASAPADRSAPAQESATTPQPPATQPPIPHPSPPPALRLSPIPHPHDLEIETRLGGLFYLVNLGLFLGLYGDFTAPAAPGIALDIWDFVALLGAELVVEEDPVWELLALLAGRAPHEPPGQGFDPPAEWRTPAEWLAPFATDERPWRWSAAGGRLRLQHPAGFALLDVPLEPGDPLLQLTRELAPFFPLSCRSGRQAQRRGRAGAAAAAGVRADVRPALRAWLEWLLPYVCARLRRALGLREDADPAGVLLLHHARIGVTATRLDIHLGLAELPIALRLAGLDRDPGWVPAAGRSIAFHFE